jgi:hypothetical protein
MHSIPIRAVILLLVGAALFGFIGLVFRLPNDMGRKWGPRTTEADRPAVAAKIATVVFWPMAGLLALVGLILLIVKVL